MISPLSFQLLKQLKADMELVADTFAECAELAVHERDITTNVEKPGRSVIEAQVTYTIRYAAQMHEKGGSPQAEMDLGTNDDTPEKESNP